MKRTTLLALFLFLLLPATPNSFAEKVATMPAPTGYIDDYANVLSAPAKSDMEELARELHNKTKAQVFLVTIKTLEDEPVETFANELFAKWKIGEKKTDRGVLLLFAINDHKRWIEVGYGLEGILNDAKVGDIGRDMVPELKAANYDGATALGLREISKVIATDSGVMLDNLEATSQATEATPPPPVEAAPSSENPTAARWLFILPILFPFLFFAFIIWRVIVAVRRGVGTGAGTRSSWSDSFGSSSDSGSSFSSGSDDSFSGGDGGSSGGGGAGGDW
jgi:uncharacterized protein